MPIELANAKITEYLLDVIPYRDPILLEMEEYARQRNFPIVGPLVGRLLFLLARTLNAKRILELGSGYGYSAYWFAHATSDDARIICTEGSKENAARAESYFKRGDISQKIDFRTGNALEIIETLSGEFDIIFNDIDKHEYPDAFQKALPRLRKGGLLISDNVLWSGRIVEPNPDRDTAGILTYNRLIHSSPELFSTIIPLRDGVSVTMKL